MILKSAGTFSTIIHPNSERKAKGFPLLDESTWAINKGNAILTPSQMSIVELL